MANQNYTAQFVSYKVHNCEAPSKESLALAVTLDFTTKGDFTVDATQAQANNQLDFCQSIYYDNSANAHDVTLTFGVTKQTLILRASKQGYLPVLCTEHIQFEANCGTTGGTCPIWLLNFPVPAAVW